MIDHSDRHLLQAFYKAALFMKAKCETEGWQPSSNYLREHVRCATGLQFTNSKSPEILRALLREHPELAPYIGLKPLKRPATGRILSDQLTAKTAKH